MIAKAVSMRNALKKRKPAFRNHGSHKIKGITTHYRRPRGLQNKMRCSVKGHMRKISIGFRSPAAARGLTREGLLPRLVYTAKDLMGLEAGKHGVLIAGTVGMKKRATLIQSASKAKLTIINYKDPVGYLKTVENDLVARKERKTLETQRKAKKEETKKEEKKVEKKEESKEAAKKELDKTLTRKEP